MRNILFCAALFLLLIGCSDERPKSSEEKASDLTRSLIKEMQAQDSIEALQVDTIAIDSLK